MRKKRLLLILVVCVLAVSIPVTIALIHQGQQPSDGGGGTADVPTDEQTDTPAIHSTLTILSMTEGNVLVMKAGTDSWIEALVGMSLELGDTIKSGDGSSAEITFFDGSTIELDAGTQVEVASLNITGTGSTTIGLKQVIGTTLSRVTQLVDTASSYEVETPAGVAAVRGSVMLVYVIEDGTTWVTNQEGEIWVTANGVTLQIPEGRKCIIISGQSPQLVPSGGEGEGGGGGGGGEGLLPPPDIAITKMPDLTQVHEGDVVTYTYTVTNPGHVPLSHVSVTDDRIKDVTYQSGDSDHDGKLDVNETWIFTASYNVTTDDVSPLVNRAVAAGTYGARTIIAWASASVEILPSAIVPAIALNKTAEPTQAHVGDNITYTYTVTNAGNVPLYYISIIDDKIEGITPYSGDSNENEILDLGETWVFMATYTISAEDESPLVNNATAYGTYAPEQTVTAQANATVDILLPAIAMTKTAEPIQAHVGDNITYTYTITNPGNTPLSAISVTDDKTGNITYGGGYQSGDTNGDEILDVDETWVFTATYTISAEDESPLVNTATVSGTDALSRSVESEEDTASVDILRPIVVRFPDEGTAYVGYEDRQGSDFDYNDFGMSISIEEVYNGDCLSTIRMRFESVLHLAGDRHDIHVLRTLSSSTFYNYTIARTTPAQGTETPAVTNASGQDDFNIILFDTSHFMSGDTVTINIEIVGGCEPYDSTPTPPRWDLASTLAYYDFYMRDRTTRITHHIGDWMPAVPPLPTTGYNVPYILVVPVTNWQAPAEGQCITNLYPYFDDYYHYGSPEGWYE